MLLPRLTEAILNGSEEGIHESLDNLKENIEALRSRVAEFKVDSVRTEDTLAASRPEAAMRA